MLHQPASSSGKDPASPYKMKIGAWIFLLYAIVYAGFVAINLIQPTAMEAQLLLGLNLAVLYGIGLIVFALILALIYNHLCNRREIAMACEEGKRGNAEDPLSS